MLKISNGKHKEIKRKILKLRLVNNILHKQNTKTYHIIFTIAVE